MMQFVFKNNLGETTEASYTFDRKGIRYYRLDKDLFLHNKNGPAMMGYNNNKGLKTNETLYVVHGNIL